MYERFVLENGLTVITNKRNSKKVVLLVGVKVGSVNEDQKISGVNHFIEHMLFKSNPYRGHRQIKEELEDRGAEVNAYSDHTDMYFYIKDFSSELSKIIEIIFQAVTNKDFDLKEFSLEKRNILSEMHLVPEQPMSYAYEDLFKPVLFQGTPIAKPIAGTQKSLQHMKRSDLADFKKKWYVPNNMVIVACGGFDEKELKDKIANTFGAMEPNHFPVKKLSVRVKNERREFLKGRENIEHAYIHLGYRIPGALHKDFYKLEVVASILGNGLSSRLFYELRDRRGLGYAVSCGIGAWDTIGVFSANITLFRPTLAKIKMTEEVIINEFEKLKKNLVEERELQRAKDLILSSYYDEIERIEYRALDMLVAEMLGIPYNKYRRFPAHIKSVSDKAVMAAARRYLTHDYTLTALVPQKMEI